MKTFIDFREAIGRRESGGNYKVVNKFGFLGKYQFGKPRLYDLGFSIDGWKPWWGQKKCVITKEMFLDFPELQDWAFKRHVNDLKQKILKKHGSKLETDFILDGKLHTLTLSGAIAGAHLKGLGGLKRFLKGDDNSDALGTKISEYIIKFGDYDV